MATCLSILDMARLSRANEAGPPSWAHAYLVAHRIAPMMTLEEIRRIFDYQPPTNQKTQGRHRAIRKAIEHTALVVLANTPTSAEQSKAIQLLREAMFYANAAITCHPNGSFNPAVEHSILDVSYVEAAKLIAEKRDREG